MSLEDIVLYKEHQIVLLKANLSNITYVNGYVYLEKLQDLNISEGNLPNETFWRGNVVGVDTAHYHNEGMTYEQKKQDAINQIKEIVDEYEKLLKCKKKTKSQRK